jgi:hypothetical protein
MPVFNILDLPEDQKKLALEAFAELAYGQRNGDPEAFGGAGNENPDLFYATGMFTWLTEHVGDITHRMALPFHVIELSCGVNMVAPKIRRCLDDMTPRLADTIDQQCRNNYDYNNMESVMSYEDYMALIKKAGERYSDAHAKLPVWNEAQYHARQAAVCLGRFDFSGCKRHLSSLNAHIGSPEDWVAYAGQVTIENGKPVSYRKSLSESDNDDTMKPVPMDSPKVLFRSVSIPEIIDILRTGKVTGRLNKFNDFDRRRHVFFGDHVSSKLIWQGEEVDRQVIAAMSENPIHTEFERLEKEVRKLTQERITMAKKVLDTINEKRAAIGRDPMPWDEGNPPLDWIIKMGEFYKIRSPLYKSAQRISALQTSMNALQKSYREQYQAEYKRLKPEIMARRFTSAIIETYPVTGGLHYSKKHGQSGMGDEDEYGFASGQIKLSDIHQIFWVKNKTVERVTSVKDAEEIIKQLIG